ncbi:MAG: hypothetical protein LBV77_00455 [Candidatus Adiutrix intracellularis]|nr:hypothetical protein [Candidatus Adiutrix intracellularis]
MEASNQDRPLIHQHPSKISGIGGYSLRFFDPVDKICAMLVNLKVHTFIAIFWAE